MPYTIDRGDATQITITARVPYAELKPLLPKAAAKISEETEIEGFRKGHAPYEVVRQKTGEFKIFEEAARKYIADNFEKLLAEVEEREFKGKSFEPIGEPQVAITKLAPGEELEYKITLPLLPLIELPDYRAIAKRVLATKKVEEVTEKEVQSSLDWLRESRTTLLTVHRGAHTGDRVEIDFSTSHGGAVIEGGESKNHPFTLGKGRFLPGFEDELVGMKAGEEKAFTLAVPPDYREKSFAGKTLDFRATMKLVQERDMPAWNDEFARSLGNFPSVAAVEKSVRDGLIIEREAKERERLRMATVEAIAAETTAEIPALLVRQELEKMGSELKESVEPMGLTFSDYLTHIKKTEGELELEWRPAAERRVKIALVLRAIGRREGVRPSEEDIQAATNRVIRHRGIRKEEFERLDRRALFEYARGIARNEKVFELLEQLR